MVGRYLRAGLPAEAGPCSLWGPGPPPGTSSQSSASASAGWPRKQSKWRSSGYCKTKTTLRTIFLLGGRLCTCISGWWAPRGQKVITAYGKKFKCQTKDDIPKRRRFLKGGRVVYLHGCWGGVTLWPHGDDNICSEPLPGLKNNDNPPENQEGILIWILIQTVIRFRTYGSNVIPIS